MDYSSTGALRSPFSPRVRQSITGRRPLGLGPSRNQSKFMQSPGEPSGDIVYKTPTTTIETYGTPLPVMVTEALTFASGEVSVRLSPCGWCWVVSGRRVVCWPRTPTSSNTASPAPASTIARELTLPQTDLAHKADLVVLFYEDGAQMPSCIGVSPEGTVRYWPSVGQEGVYVDVSCELAGQECERLGEYTEEGLVLATTTCTVVLLNPTVVDGRATVSCRTQRPPSGWLGGIGRRVSLLFFGSMPQQPDTKLVGVVVLPGGPEVPGTIALVCGGPTLQLWRGAELHEHELRRPLLEAHARALLPPHGDLNSLEILALDVRASGSSGLLLLIATVNVARSPEMRYAIAHVNVTSAAAPRVLSVWAVGGAGGAGGAVRWPALGDDAPRLLPLAQRALLYTPKYLAVLSAAGPNEAVDFVDVSLEGDKILGAELCGGVPLLFSAKHGVLALSCVNAMPSTPSVCESPMGSPCPSEMYDGNLSLYEIDPHEVSMVTTDACGKLKTAFLFHVRRETPACRALLEQLFPPTPAGPALGDVDAVLDRTVMRIATEMLDDIPAGDPRWKQRGGAATNISLGSSAALSIEAQLRDKQRAFALFVDFLRAVGLWQRLGLLTTEHGDVCESERALGELAEQLAVSIALRKLQHSSHSQLIDAAIYQVVCGENPEVEEEPEVEAALSSGALSASDVCWRRVSRVRRVLRALAAGRGDAQHAAATLHVLTTALRAAAGARAAWGAGGAGGARGAGGALDNRSLLPALIDLHKRAVTQCAHNCPDPTLRSQVYEAAASLADLLLSDAEHLNCSPHTQHLYENIRREVIQPFLDEGQIERAAALAEKFKDFELLIEMCVKNDDLNRLYAYVDKYSNEGMAEVTFAWLAQRGGASLGTLLRGLGARAPAPLRAWLRRVPARAPLRAVHELSSRRYEHAAHALLHLASDETDSVCRMTTAASLAKLCLLASDDADESVAPARRRADACLALGAQHDALPRDLRLHHGLDAPDTRVIAPEELVQMYIESESKSLTEYDYKKALDLTDFIQDMELRDELRLKIWCASILRDDWSVCRVDSPAEELHNKMFFRLIDLVHVMGADVELLLPAPDEFLAARALADLLSEPTAHFLLKYGLEAVARERAQRPDDL